MPKVKKIQMPSGTTLDLPDGFDWIGTKAEYDAAWSAGLIKPEWICMITDDTADSPSRANISLDNLNSVGEARFAGKADVDLSNLSDTGHKMMDGQWVAKTQTLSTATAVGTYTIDLGPNGLNYLPDDNYNYEVWFVFGVKGNASTQTKIYISTFFIDTIAFKHVFAGPNGSNAEHFSTLTPIGIDRKLNVKIDGGEPSTCHFTSYAYRRLGNNT